MNIEQVMKKTYKTHMYIYIYTHIMIFFGPIINIDIYKKMFYTNIFLMGVNENGLRKLNTPQICFFFLI